jgi:glutamate racemase
MKRKVAVLAGTATDTRMGADFLRCRDNNIEALEYPVSKDPQQQTVFQISSENEKKKVLSDIFDDAISKGSNDFFIYCNSLSAAFDFEPFAGSRNVRVFTPMQVYRKAASAIKKAAVIAANNQSLAGIEKAMMEENPDLELAGACSLGLVKAVERKEMPQNIVGEFRLKELSEFFLGSGAECLILGCTHFPYFKKELESVCSLPILDPSEEMYRNLINS